MLSSEMEGGRRTFQWESNGESDLGEACRRDQAALGAGDRGGEDRFPEDRALMLAPWGRRRNGLQGSH